MSYNECEALKFVDKNPQNSVNTNFCGIEKFLFYFSFFLVCGKRKFFVVLHTEKKINITTKKGSKEKEKKI